MLIISRKIKILIAAEKDEGSTNLVTALGNRSGILIDIFQSTDPIKCIKYIESSNPDIVYIGPGMSETKRLDFFRWVKGANFEENLGLICHFENESDIAIDQMDLILGSDVDEVIIGRRSADEISNRIKHLVTKKEKKSVLQQKNRILEKENVTDELTGLSNMKGFRLGYARIFSEFQRNTIDTGEAGVATVMLDLDHFKSVNDRYNHLVGSHVIKEVGRLLDSLPLQTNLDTKARYGGDEYVLAFEAKSIEEVKVYADLIVERIRKATFFYDQHSISVTVSVGVGFADHRFKGNEGDLLKAADLALYKSKENGRNQATVMDISDIRVLKAAEKARSDLLQSTSEAILKIKSLSA